MLCRLEPRVLRVCLSLFYQNNFQAQPFSSGAGLQNLIEALMMTYGRDHKKATTVGFAEGSHHKAVRIPIALALKAVCKRFTNGLQKVC